MKIFRTILSLCLVGMIFSGCTTIECGGQKDKDGTLTVVATKKKGGALNTVVDLGVGAAATVALPGVGTALLYGAKKLANAIPLSDADKANIVKEAQEAAEKYVRENSANFCNECSSGVCQAKATTHKIELVGDPVFIGDRDVWTVTFRFKYEASVSCAPCAGEECQKMASSTQDMAPACQLNPGTDMIILDENTRIPLESLAEVLAQ